MRSLGFIPICFALALAGCFDDKDPAAGPVEKAKSVENDDRTPVDKLSFDQLKEIVSSCQESGKIVTDNYCKEAAYVYQRKDIERRERERLARDKKERYETKSKVIDY